MRNLHVLRVVTFGCSCCDGDTEHGYFPADKLEEAIKVAKANISPHDATCIQVVPFGERRKADGTYNEATAPTHVWEHDPRECQRMPWDACEVCQAHIEAERKYEEEERARRARGEVDEAAE